MVNGMLDARIMEEPSTITTRPNNVVAVKKSKLTFMRMQTLKMMPTPTCLKTEALKPTHLMPFAIPRLKDEVVPLKSSSRHPQEEQSNVVKTPMSTMVHHLHLTSEMLKKIELSTARVLKKLNSDNAVKDSHECYDKALGDSDCFAENKSPFWYTRIKYAYVA